jgi:4-diphosphocytidyl-2-C-methyl-D-erythritol kinase
VNLYLDVSARRSDGYHDIETLFLELPWGDEVILERGAREGIDLVVEGDAGVPRGEENLAYRAAAAYLAAADEAGRRPEGGVRLRLKKRVPPGAGLGGGSSDAATVLRLLEQEHRCLDRTRLEGLAAGLGADVAFFLRGGAAIGRERGDRLEGLPPPPPLEIVLIIPPLHNDTARVYAHADRRLRPAPAGGLQAAVDALATGEAAHIRAAHYNALAVPAMTAYPPFLRFTSEVERRLGRPPAVTGTGCALFDVLSPGEGEEILARLDGVDARLVHLRP